MNAVQKAIATLQDVVSNRSVILYAEPLAESASEAIQALQSLEGEAVNDQVYKLSELMRGLEIPPEAVAGNNPGFFYLIGKHIAEQAKAGAKPLPPAVPDAISKFIAKKKSEIEQYADEYCRLEPDTNAAVWDSEYHQQHEEDISEFIAQLESVIAAAQQGGGA